MRLKFTCNWCSDKNLYLRILNNYAIKPEYFDLLTFRDDYDYLIIINNSNHYIKDRKKTIGLVMEPSWQSWNKNLHHMCEIVLFHDKNLYNHENVIEWINCGFLHDLISIESFLETLPNNMIFKNIKNKNISFVCGEINDRQLGYKLRRDVVKNLKNTTVDLYGRNINFNPEIKSFGPLKFKYSGLLNYKFSVCIENTFEKNYISEKLYDCFICDVVPIYCGAPNILDIFDNQSLIKVNCLEEILNVIKKIENGEIIYEDFKIESAKTKYLNEINLINQVINTITKYNL